jgi:hydroxymethylglutaryl-CoA synthase
VSDVAAGWDQKGGRGTLAVCGPDEDTLTLAWGAARDALEAAGRLDVDGLWWGTARPPMPEGPSLAYLCSALGIADGAAGLLAGGSTHAGVDALNAAWDALAAGAVSTALVVVSDALIPGPGTGAEKSTGAGAVAWVLTAAADGAQARLTARAQRTRPLLDRYRGEGHDGTGDPYDPRLYREKELLPSAASAVAALSEGAPAGARWSVPDPDGRLGKAVAKAVGAADVASSGTFAKVGDTGAAAPFLGLLGALASAGPAVMVATGGGRSSAVVLDVSSPVPGAETAIATLDGGARGTRPVTYASVLRARRQLVPLSEPVPMGIPPGSAAFVRGGEEVLALEGKKCASCGKIAVPPTVHPVCPYCGSADGAIVPLARTGVVHTFVINHTMPSPFEAPLPLVVVDLDDGARMLLQGMSEDAAAVGIGDRIELELRRYAIERGVPVYGFKVRRSVSQSGASGNGTSAAAPTGVAAGAAN